MTDNKNESREIPITFEGEESPEASSAELLEPQPEMEMAGAGDPGEVSHSASDDPEDDPPVSESRGDAAAQLQAQLEAVTTEKNSLYEKLIWRQAEFENYRKRVERERAELYQHGRDDVLLQFLPVVDNFERALSSLETSEGDAEALRHGVELIHKQFKDALSKFGLEAVEAVGQTFDPHVHEAVTTEATDKHKENTVIQEFQRGYRIGDRLLRPAKVKVAASPEK